MISFNGIPAGIRVPLFYAEFDNTAASKGPTLKVFKALIVGQMTSAGTATANVPVQVFSEGNARTLFGVGSMLHLMFKKWFLNNTFTPVFGLPLADNGTTKAAATLTVTGPATASGTIFLYIAGVQIQVAVNSGDAQNSIASAINTAIGANVAVLPVTATVSTNVVTLTANNAGTIMNDVDVRLNYNAPVEALPAGVAIAISSARLSGGATDPSLTTAITNMGETQYDVIVTPYTASTPLSALETELDSRWGPLRQIEGLGVTFYSGTVGAATTFGLTRNDPHICCASLYNAPNPNYEWAAAYGAIIAYYGQIDPARPFQTLPLQGLLAPALADRQLRSDRESLLNSGIATISIDSAGKPRVERAITMYQKNTFGDADVSYLSVNTVLTLGYLRYDMRALWTTKYPRHKLANDGQIVGPGQAIMTPNLARAECLAKFRQWSDLGLVEDYDQFKRDLVVERDATDVTRLNFLVPPNLVNQLVVAAMKFQFIL